MGNSRWNTGLQLFANLGVLIGLVLLAYELKINTDMMRAQMISASTSGHQAAEVVMMGENPHEAYAKSVIAPHELTPAEVIQLWAYLGANAVQWSNTYSLYQAGILTVEDWQQEAAQATSYLTYGFGAEWWRVMKTSPGMANNEALADIDRAVEAVDRDLVSSQMASLLEWVAKQDATTTMSPLKPNERAP